MLKTFRSINEKTQKYPLKGTIYVKMVTFACYPIHNSVVYCVTLDKVLKFILQFLHLSAKDNYSN